METRHRHEEDELMERLWDDGGPDVKVRPVSRVSFIMQAHLFSSLKLRMNSPQGMLKYCQLNVFFFHPTQYGNYGNWFHWMDQEDFIASLTLSYMFI